MGTKQKLEKALSPILEDILDDYFGEEDLQKVDFRTYLMSIAMSVIANYTTQGISACYSIFQEKVVPLITNNGSIPLNSDDEKQLFVISYNAVFEEDVKVRDLTQSLKEKM